MANLRINSGSCRDNLSPRSDKALRTGSLGFLKSGEERSDVATPFRKVVFNPMTSTLEDVGHNNIS